MCALWFMCAAVSNCRLRVRLWIMNIYQSRSPLWKFQLKAVIGNYTFERSTNTTAVQNDRLRSSRRNFRVSMLVCQCARIQLECAFRDGLKIGKLLPCCRQDINNNQIQSHANVTASKRFPSRSIALASSTSRLLGFSSRQLLSDFWCELYYRVTRHMCFDDERKLFTKSTQWSSRISRTDFGGIRPCKPEFVARARRSSEAIFQCTKSPAWLTCN